MKLILYGRRSKVEYYKSMAKKRSTGGICTQREVCMVHDGGRVDKETTGRGAKHLYQCTCTIIYMRRLECAMRDKLLES